MIATMLPPHRSVLVALLLACSTASAVAAPKVSPQITDKQRYDDCLSQAGLNPTAALASANKWLSARGGPPAQHCAAVALMGLKRYRDAAEKLDALGRAPGMGTLRPALFDQAGNAWMLEGETGKAIDSFQSALALSASDADLYADLARAQAMQDDWSQVESDLNAALAIQPRRADLLVLRASARAAQHRIAEAKADAEAAVTLTPRDPNALVERGSVKRDGGDLKGARADFQAALALNPPAEVRDAAERNLAALDAAAKPKPAPSPKKKTP